ncbi:MAG: hypothetical protein PVSMB8_11200 [Vulcanimicrobiaceae bacterium]
MTDLTESGRQSHGHDARAHVAILSTPFGVAASRLAASRPSEGSDVRQQALRLRRNVAGDDLAGPGILRDLARNGRERSRDAYRE